VSSSVITAIVPSPRKQGRFDLVVDGKPLATLGLESIESMRLNVGGTFDAPLAAAVEREAGLLATYDRALNMLAVRARSSAELHRLLVRKGEPPEYVDAALERLRQAGFLDDASFARQFSRSKALGAGMSKRRLEQELGRRGVAGEQAREAIDEVFTEEAIDEESTIERVARKKMRSLVKLDEPTRRRRLFTFLARRGYDFDDIERVTRRLLHEPND